MLSPTIARALGEQHRRDLLVNAARHGPRRRGPAAPHHRFRLAVGAMLVTTGVWVAGRHRGSELARMRPFLMEM